MEVTQEKWPQVTECVCPDNEWKWTNPMSAMASFLQGLVGITLRSTKVSLPLDYSSDNRWNFSNVSDVFPDTNFQKSKYQCNRITWQ